MVDAMLRITIKLAVLNLKLVIVLGYQKTKTFLLKDILQVCLKKVLWLKKLKILFQGHMLLMLSMVKKLLERFMRNKYKKQINKDLG